MVLPPLTEDSAVTEWPAPVLKTGVQEQAASVQVVFQPSWETQTNLPPSTQVLASCWSGASGVQNRAAGSQSDRGVTPTMPWPAQVGGAEVKEWPPSVLRYTVPSTYSPVTSFALLGLMTTSKPSPPAGSAIWLALSAKYAEPLS